MSTIHNEVTRIIDKYLNLTSKTCCAINVPYVYFVWLYAL